MKQEKMNCVFIAMKNEISHIFIKNAKIYFLQGGEERDDIGTYMEPSEEMEPLKEEIVVEEEVKPEISLSVILATTNRTTMIILGTIRDTQVVILVNSGNTHNFLDSFIVQKFKLPIDTNITFPVKITNDGVIHNVGLCSNVTTKFQCNLFKPFFYVLSLGGCDVVLEVS